MKKVYTFLIIVMMLLGCSLSEDSVVYITSTGDRFHNWGCEEIDGPEIGVKVKEAKERGYFPCSVCKPY